MVVAEGLDFCMQVDLQLGCEGCVASVGLPCLRQRLQVRSRARAYSFFFMTVN